MIYGFIAVRNAKKSENCAPGKEEKSEVVCRVDCWGSCEGRVDFNYALVAL